MGAPDGKYDVACSCQPRLPPASLSVFSRILYTLWRNASFSMATYALSCLEGKVTRLLTAVLGLWRIKARCRQISVMEEVVIPMQPPAASELRPALRNWISDSLGNASEFVLCEELGICRGQARVDLAVVNGTIHGYEIKSDRDSLRRLAGQVELYSRVLDYSSLVIGGRHLEEAREIVPSWWGIVRIDRSPKRLLFKAVRRARKNPGRDPRSLVELLWLDDAIALLEERDAARGVRGKPRRAVWNRVCECFDVDEIAEAVRVQLKARARMPDLAPLL